jgi:hypothetical protein
MLQLPVKESVHGRCQLVALSRLFQKDNNNNNNNVQ